MKASAWRCPTAAPRGSILDRNGSELAISVPRTTVAADSRLASEEFGRFASKHVGEHTRGVVEAVRTAAAGLGVAPAVVALAWVRDRHAVAAPIIGPRTPTQLAALLESEDVDLPEQIVAALDEVSIEHT